jgi:hypothetical protein
MVPEPNRALTREPDTGPVAVKPDKLVATPALARPDGLAR